MLQVNWESIADLRFWDSGFVVAIVIKLSTLFFCNLCAYACMDYGQAFELIDTARVLHLLIPGWDVFLFLKYES